MRYRKVRGDMWWWIKRDRYATTDATDPRFGGAGLRVTDIEGDYS
jgi:hypothetical protein